MLAPRPSHLLICGRVRLVPPTQYIIRNVILPCVGWLGGCGCMCCALTAFGIMAIVYSANNLGMGRVLEAYVISKGISLVLAVFPLGLLSYQYRRSCHKPAKEAAGSGKEPAQAV